MQLTFKPSIPIKQTVDRIVRTLNTQSQIEASSEFISEIPRHYLITIEIPDNSTHQDILEIGALMGVLDNDR